MENVQKETGKISLASEGVYLASLILLSLAVAMLTAADFGMSMVVAPAYLLSLKVGVLSFGQAEYVIQAALFLLFCLCMRRFRVSYLFSFVTCLLYGVILDLWRLLPLFNPGVTAPGSMALPVRILLFAGGMFLTAFSVMLSFKTYLPPQVYDYFVNGVSGRYGIRLSRFKTGFDLACLAVSLLLTFVFFGQIVALGWGTVGMALCNGTLIGFLSRLYDRFFVSKPLFSRVSSFFAATDKPGEN